MRPTQIIQGTHLHLKLTEGYCELYLQKCLYSNSWTCVGPNNWAPKPTKLTSHTSDFYFGGRAKLAVFCPVSSMLKSLQRRKIFLVIQKWQFWWYLFSCQITKKKREKENFEKLGSTSTLLLSHGMQTVLSALSGEWVAWVIQVLYSSWTLYWDHSPDCAAIAWDVGS